MANFPVVLLQEEKKAKKSPTYREMRFLHFASVEYKGVIYMTPQDFLESVTEDMPRRRFYDLRKNRTMFRV